MAVGNICSVPFFYTKTSAAWVHCILRHSEKLFFGSCNLPFFFTKTRSWWPKVAWNYSAFQTLLPNKYFSGITVENWDTVKSCTLKFLQCNLPFFFAKNKVIMTKEKPGILHQSRPLFPKFIFSGITVENWDTVKSCTLKYLQCNLPFFIAKNKVIMTKEKPGILQQSRPLFPKFLS